MKEFAPRLDSLPRAQQAIWPRLQPLRDMGFVLYGGTAIALHFGHRESIDFDFFSERPLQKDALRAAMPVLGQSQTIQDARNTLVALISGPAEATAKLSFFGGIGFGRVGEPLITDDAIALVASPEDLFGTKFKALLDRVEAKDYSDIIALLRSGVPLEVGLGAARTLFGKAFQPAEALKTLTYFEGGDLDTLARSDREFLVNCARRVDAIPDMPLVTTALADQVRIT